MTHAHVTDRIGPIERRAERDVDSGLALGEPRSAALRVTSGWAGARVTSGVSRRIQKMRVCEPGGSRCNGRFGESFGPAALAPLARSRYCCPTLSGSAVLPFVQFTIHHRGNGVNWRLSSAKAVALTSKHCPAPTRVSRGRLTTSAWQ